MRCICLVFIPLDKEAVLQGGASFYPRAVPRTGTVHKVILLQSLFPFHDSNACNFFMLVVNYGFHFVFLIGTIQTPNLWLSDEVLAAIRVPVLNKRCNRAIGPRRDEKCPPCSSNGRKPQPSLSEFREGTRAILKQYTKGFTEDAKKHGQDIWKLGYKVHIASLDFNTHVL